MTFTRKALALITLLAAFWIAAPDARADSIVLSSQGVFSADNGRPQFTFSLTEASILNFRTYSYGGGVNAQGVFVAPGGFDPILTLFDSGGNFMREFTNSTGPGDISALLALGPGVTPSSSHSSATSRPATWPTASSTMATQRSRAGLPPVSPGPHPRSSTQMVVNVTAATPST